jgi:hypothetical protein
MALDRQQQVVRRHAAAIVGDRDQRFAAVANADFDAARAGVEGVFHQFLDDRSRPFNHLAGGDPVDDGLRQSADGQESPPPASAM